MLLEHSILLFFEMEELDNLDLKFFLEKIVWIFDLIKRELWNELNFQ